MRTFGLGGDSEVHFVSQGLQGGVIGPRRVLPVSLPQRLTPTLFTPPWMLSCGARCLGTMMAVLYAALMSLKRGD